MPNGKTFLPSGTALARIPWGVAVIVIAALVVIVRSGNGSDFESAIGPTGDSSGAWPVASTIELQEARLLLEKLAEGPGRPYIARQLVTQMSEPQSAAVVEVAVDGDTLLIDGDTAIPAPKINPLRVDSKYDLAVSHPESQMGLQLIAIDFIRKSDGRRTERLYLDEQTSMVHRREVWGPDGILAITAVLDIDWDIEWVPTDSPSDRRVKEQRSVYQSGFPRQLPYGYTYSAGFELADDASQAVYFDGLHSLSVFRHPGVLSSRAGFTTDSAGVLRGPGAGTWAWQGGDAAYTLIAEESQLEIGVLSEDLPQGGPSTTTRLTSWWSKLGNALTGE